MRMSRLFLVALFFISVGTVFVVAQTTPEAFVVASADGRVVIEGKGIGEQNISIERLDDSMVPFTAVVGPVYELSPTPAVFLNPMTLSIRYDDVVSSEDEIYRSRVGYFDESLGVWRSVDAQRHPSEGTLTATITHFFRWALLVVDPVARPDLSVESQTLIDSPPPGAIGYEAFVSYADQPGDFVLLNGFGKTGGCGGQFRSGNSTQITSAEQNFSDVLTYRVQVRWQIGEGCDEQSPIE